MTLYERYLDPPREHSMRPFWFWNAHLTPAEVERQIEAMVAQGVYGAYVHCRSGLRPPYLSEDWWKLVEAAVDKARELDFALCVVDEYNWPSGDARDYTLEGYPSRVLAADEGFRMRTLVPSRGLAQGADFVVAGERHPSGELDADSLRLVDLGNGIQGDEVVYSFTLKAAVSFDGGLVDVMSAEAIRTFLDLVYEQYSARLGDAFGPVLRGIFCDHEGDVGYRLGWTPALRETFQRMKGYDLVPLLPLLLEEGGPRTPVVRCDYFDVVAELYAENFFGQLARFGEEHGVDVTGHVWEESLQAAAAFQGDHFRVQRRWTTPGVDSLFEWGRLPRHFLEARSVAHFRGRGFMCENQGVQGADSYLSPERIKRVTNAIANWGVTLFVPHALNGNPDRIDFPEDWFEQQPWWPFFHHYANYVRRLSFMNAGARHVCELVLYYPIESVWAHGDPCFDAAKWDYIFEGADDLNGPRVTWNNPADEVDRVYGQIIETLPSRQWDLDVIDDHYLAEAQIGKARIALAEESFGVLILPPMTCMRRSAAARARAFAEAGGLVVAVGRLATDSMEAGRDDVELQRLLAGTEVVADVEALVTLLEERVPKDVRTTAEHLYATHLVKDGLELYFFVNDSEERRHVEVEVAARGRPMVWDPDGGERRPVRVADGKLQLAFEPWQAYHIVFEDGPAEPPGEEPEPEPEHLLTVEGSWHMTPQPGKVPVAYAASAVCRAGEGLALGWHRPELNDRFWTREWLSAERFTIRDWWVVGPFDYHDHLGYNQIYPPERELDLAATYEGKDGRRLAWRRYESTDRVVDLDAASGLGLAHWGGMQFKTSFALTHVWSREHRQAELRVVGDSNAKVWLNGELILAERDDHQGYLELRDAYGFRIPVRLAAGWNPLLLKVSQAMRYGGTFGFVARVCDVEGRPVTGIAAAASPSDAEPAPQRQGERWYRLLAPAGTTSLTLPPGCESAELFLGGRRTEAIATPRESMLALRLPDCGELHDFPTFSVGRAERLLGSLTHTGLSFHAGRYEYETEFDLPHVDGRLCLDLGDVGVAAEVWLNERKVGEQVWRPYVFDVTEAARPGRNALKIIVANTRASERARGPDQLALWNLTVRGSALLDRIDLNGLHGPVRVLRS